MNTQLIAVIFQEGGRLLSQFIRSRPPTRHITTIEPLPSMEEEETRATPEKTSTKEEKKPTVEGTACIPCVNGHFSICSGLVSDEAIRMARRHGITDEEIRRVNKCLDQLNAMEREDLAIENIQTLPQWEKELAIYAQNESASIRHKLENLTSVDELEEAAIQVNQVRTKIGREYFKSKLSHMPKEEKKELAQKALEKLEREA